MDRGKEQRAFYCGYLAGFTRCYQEIKKITEYECLIDRDEIEKEIKEYLKVINRSTDGENQGFI